MRRIAAADGRFGRDAAEPYRSIALVVRAFLLSCAALVYVSGSINTSPHVATAHIRPPTHNRLIEELRKYADPLTSAYPHGTESDLAPVLRAVGSAKVVAMGEATHGTGDFFALKGRVFRYLAEHDGLRVLAMEANWSDGLKIDDYLQTGNGNLSNILHATWDYQEVLALLQWMRQYNELHPHTLHFFGMDMQQPKTAIPYIQTFYERIDPRKAATLMQALACVNKPTMTLFTDGLTDAAQCVNNTRAVVKQIRDDGQQVTAGNSVAYLAAFHAAELTEEAAIEYAKRKVEEKAAARDLAMAHNVQWLRTTPYPSSKVFVWAHNDHVAVGLEQWPSMGTILRESYGTDYFTIGQTFNQGMVAQAQMGAAYIGPARPGTSEAVFRAAEFPIFFLDFRTVPRNTVLGRWLAQPQWIRSLGGNAITTADAQNEMKAILPAAFDSLIFVNDARPAKALMVAVQRDLRCCLGYSGLLPSAQWSFHSFIRANAAGGTTTLADGRKALYLTAMPEDGEDLISYLDGRSSAEAFQGHKLIVNGMLATSQVEGGASVILAIFGNDRYRPLVYRSAAPTLGTNKWTAFSITAAVPGRAKMLAVVLLLHGAGTAWLSDLALQASTKVSAAHPPPPLWPHHARR